MKTIKWNLEFKNMDYLNSLTSNLANLDFVKIVTGVQTESGDIDSCNITITAQEEENVENKILELGVIIGSHLVGYSITQVHLQIMEDEEQEREGAPKGEDFVPSPLHVEELRPKKDFSTGEEEISPSAFETLLRKILVNFKKQVK